MGNPPGGAETPRTRVGCAVGGAEPKGRGLAIFLPASPPTVRLAHWLVQTTRRRGANRGEAHPTGCRFLSPHWWIAGKLRHGHLQRGRILPQPKPESRERGRDAAGGWDGCRPSRFCSSETRRALGTPTVGQGLPPLRSHAGTPRSRVPPCLRFPAALPPPRSPRITPGGTQTGNDAWSSADETPFPCPRGPVPVHAAPRGRTPAEANRNSSHAPRPSPRTGGGGGHVGDPKQRGAKGLTLGPIGDRAGGGRLGCHRAPHSAMQREEGEVRGGGGRGVDAQRRRGPRSDFPDLAPPTLP